jgi:hypothetical protein
MQGKLADNHYIPTRAQNIQVHYALTVVENPQTGNFFAEPFPVFVSIGFFDTYKNQ